MKSFFLALWLCILPVFCYAMPTAAEIEEKTRSPVFSHALEITQEGNFLSLWESDVKASVMESFFLHKKHFLILLSGLLFYALLLAFSPDFKNTGFLGRMVLSAVCLEQVATEITAAVSAVQEMAGLIQVLLPSLCVLTAASGGAFRAAAVQAVGLICGEVGAAVIAGWVIPLVVYAFLTGVFHGVGEISLQGVSRLFSSLGKWILALVLSLSVGALAISGFAAGMKDSMTMKTAKFLTSSLVPVAGAALSQAAESVAASAGLLRGTVGTAGLIAVILYLLKPVVRLLSVMFMYRLLSAAADVLCGDQQAAVFAACADTFALLIGAVASMGVMCFFAMAVLLGGVS